MEINHLMSANLALLQQTLGIGLLKSSMSTQTAQATVMLEDFAQTQQVTNASHPSAGRYLDMRV